MHSRGAGTFTCSLVYSSPSSPPRLSLLRVGFMERVKPSVLPSDYYAARENTTTRSPFVLPRGHTGSVRQGYPSMHVTLTEITPSAGTISAPPSAPCPGRRLC